MTPLGSRAVSVLVAGLIVLSACSSPNGGLPTPPQSASPTGAPSAAPSTSPTLAPITIPEAVAGELARSVVTGDAIESTTVARASGAREYHVRGECRSDSVENRYSYTVTIDGARAGSGNVACDGSVTVNSLGPVTDGAVVSIQLAPLAEAKPGTGYVAILPAP